MIHVEMSTLVGGKEGRRVSINSQDLFIIDTAGILTGDARHAVVSLDRPFFPYRATEWASQK